MTNTDQAPEVRDLPVGLQARGTRHETDSMGGIRRARRSLLGAADPTDLTETSRASLAHALRGRAAATVNP